MIEDLTHGAARISVRPDEALSVISMVTWSGAITGVGANSPVFSLRNIGANPVLVRRIGLGFITTTAFTAAQLVDFYLLAARSWTVSDSGGTGIGLTGNNCKRRTSLAALTNVDSRISTTGALTPGTRVNDTNAFAQISGWSGGAGEAIKLTPDNVLGRASTDYPQVMATNEGFVIVLSSAMGAAGVGKLYVNIEVSEALAY